MAWEFCVAILPSAVTGNIPFLFKSISLGPL
nr:MAG TPA: hypothetical protein [Caudoviricetes sp.]